MGRQPIYSSSRDNAITQKRGLNIPASQSSSGPDGKEGNASIQRGIDAAGSVTSRSRLSALLVRHERYLLVGLGALLSIVAVLIYEAATPDSIVLTQEDIDASVLYALDNLPPEPAASAVAYEAIRPSVVLVRRLTGEGENRTEEGVGTGVVVVDSGAILTSLHVVIMAELIHVVFADGFETSARLVSAQPDQDLAIIQVDVVPEGLVPATLATTRGLSPGDEVVAVGHPFGIGESTSAGVISGLGRSYVSEGGETLLSNLIQFDAAVNPGNSGGPLVNMNGEVIGIVSSIYNPSRERVFVGIGFAVPIETAASGFGQLPY